MTMDMNGKRYFKNGRARDEETFSCIYGSNDGVWDSRVQFTDRAPAQTGGAGGEVSPPRMARRWTLRSLPCDYPQVCT